MVQRSLSKKEIAQLLGFSTKTLSKILNNEIFEELQKTGYKKTDKLLYEKQIEILDKRIGFKP